MRRQKRPNPGEHRATPPASHLVVSSSACFEVAKLATSFLNFTCQLTDSMATRVRAVGWGRRVVRGLNWWQTAADDPCTRLRTTAVGGVVVSVGNW
eukprot:m.259318 g.259318  ORF g.259318 m.259318 type:complete len:96 (+) comp26635_c0_seq27:2799-3086(+)